MKKILAILSAAAILLSLAACGSGASAPEATSNAAAGESVVEQAQNAVEGTTEAPESGRIKEMTSFYVITPDSWSQLTYKDQKNRLELYDIPSAPDIKKSTPMVKIELGEEKATQETLDANLKGYLMRPEAKQGADKEIGGYTFSYVTYIHTVEKKRYFIMEGLVGDKVCTITLRGISPNDEDVASILNSISFK